MYSVMMKQSDLNHGTIAGSSHYLKVDVRGVFPVASEPRDGFRGKKGCVGLP